MLAHRGGRYRDIRGMPVSPIQMRAGLSAWQIHPDKMKKALTMDMLATDLADYLVKQGVSGFRLNRFEFSLIKLHRSHSVKLITSQGELWRLRNSKEFKYQIFH